MHGQEPRSGASQTQQRSARSVELDENLQGSVTLGPASPARAVGVTLVAGDAVRFVAVNNAAQSFVPSQLYFFFPEDSTNQKLLHSLCVVALENKDSSTRMKSLMF